MIDIYTLTEILTSILITNFFTASSSERPQFQQQSTWHRVYPWLSAPAFATNLGLAGTNGFKHWNSCVSQGWKTEKSMISVNCYSSYQCVATVHCPIQDIEKTALRIFDFVFLSPCQWLAGDFTLMALLKTVCKKADKTFTTAFPNSEDYPETSSKDAQTKIAPIWNLAVIRNLLLKLVSRGVMYSVRLKKNSLFRSKEHKFKQHRTMSRKFCFFLFFTPKILLIKGADRVLLKLFKFLIFPEKIVNHLLL